MPILIMLQNYIRKCDLCNKQKNQLRDFRISGDKERWEIVLQNSLTKTIAEAERSMEDLKNQLNSR